MILSAGSCLRWILLVFGLRVRKLGWLIPVLLAPLCVSATQTSVPAKKSIHRKSTHHSVTSAKTSSSHRTVAKGKHSKKAASYKSHGQQKIDPQRAQQIQEALIRQHYLSGEASGTWDDSTEKAMQKFQADNGWQSKTTPDSRALIKLGLGPDQEHLLNPDSAMTAPPQAMPASNSTASGSEKSPR
jgi:putative peptidoglycan binding protein